MSRGECVDCGVNLVGETLHVHVTADLIYYGSTRILDINLCKACYSKRLSNIPPKGEETKQ
jgi:hypothetical protein